jgi:hypothetical protein
LINRLPHRRPLQRRDAEAPSWSRGSGKIRFFSAPRRLGVQPKTSSVRCSRNTRCACARLDCRAR